VSVEALICAPPSNREKAYVHQHQSRETTSAVKIIQLSRFDTGDGAANSAYRLHLGLLSLGYDSSLFISERRSETPDGTISLFQPPMDVRSRVRRRLRRMKIDRSIAPYRASRPTGYEAFSDDRSPHGADVVTQIPLGDVVNVHAMYKFLDYQAFFSTIPSRMPVVRTLHDMSFFTGGCHTDAGCGKYAERCGACPQLGSHDTDDLSRQIWERKRATLGVVERGRLHIVAPSRWLASEARRSPLLHDLPVHVIPHGVDIEVFRPRNRSFSREILGMAPDARMVLFVAQPVTRRVKGFTLLADALNGLRDVTNLFLVSVGSGIPPAEVHVPHRHLGPILDERFLSLVYSAADLFVIPSLQENLPLTVLEAVSCGTPTVGFAVGGVPEVVRPGITGSLVPPGDVVALRLAMRDVLLDVTSRTEMAANCRRIAVSEYALQVHVRRYIELYESLLHAA
jgi:glycosyltransferase involved in cell wall biosynthesis